MFFLSLVTDLIFYGFGLSTPFLIVLYLARPPWRPALGRLLAVSASLLLAASNAFLLSIFAEGFRAIASTHEFDSYAWLNRLSGPYWLGYWAPVLGQGLLPQLLWRRAWRGRPGMLALLVPGLFAPLAWHWLLRQQAFERDYLPSSWPAASPDLVGLLLLVAGYGLLLLIIERGARRFQG